MSKHAADQSATTSIRETQAIRALLNSDADAIFPGFGKHRATEES